MEVEAVRQGIDCFALEKQAVGPSGRDHRVVDRIRSRGSVCGSDGVSRDSAAEGDVLMQGDGVFGVFEKFFEILGRFSKALVWAYGFLKQLGLKSLFGFKRRVGFVAGRVLKRVKSVFKGIRVGAKVIKPNAKLDAISGHKLSLSSGAFSGRGSGPRSLLRPKEVLGSTFRLEVTSVADFGVDLRLSPFGGGFSDRQLVLVVESVKQAVFPPMPVPVLLPLMLMSDFPSRVRSSVDLCSFGSGLIVRQAIPSAGSILVRSGFEDFQFGQHGASSGDAEHAEFGRPSVGSVASGTPSGSLLRQPVMHSDALTLVRIFGGGTQFEKFGGPLRVSATFPPFQWVLFPPWPRPFSPVYGCPQFVSSGVFEVGESSKRASPEERDAVYPRVVQDAKSCFRTMGVSFLGSDEKGFLDFLSWTEDQLYDSDSPP
jgi:hypothetical protein